MKTLFASLALAATALCAQAETITLSTMYCGTARNCANVPNDTGADVDIYAGTSYSAMAVYIDGVLYSGPNTPSYSVLTNSSGQAVVAQIVYSTRVVKVNNGRAHYSITHYTLVSGSLAR